MKTAKSPMTANKTKAAIARGFHLFPFRTEKLNPAAPMVLRKWESRQPPPSEAGINPPIDPGLFFLPLAAISPSASLLPHYVPSFFFTDATQYRSLSPSPSTPFPHTLPRSSFQRLLTWYPNCTLHFLQPHAAPAFPPHCANGGALVGVKLWRGMTTPG